MTTSLLKTFALALATLAASTQFANAAVGDETFDIDPRFRAKIMKEKAKQNQSQADAFNFNRGNSRQQDSSQCGSQNIGNVESGRIGATPREVFVFAPNTFLTSDGKFFA